MSDLCPWDCGLPRHPDVNLDHGCRAALKAEVKRLRAEVAQEKDVGLSIADSLGQTEARLANLTTWCNENPSQWVMRSDVLAALAAAQLEEGVCPVCKRKWTSHSGACGFYAAAARPHDHGGAAVRYRPECPECRAAAKPKGESRG